MSAPGVPPVDLVVDAAVRVGRGEQPAAIAAELDVDVSVVYTSFKLIIEALPEPRHQFANLSELRAALLGRAGVGDSRAPDVPVSTDA